MVARSSVRALAPLPANARDIDAAAHRCRKVVTKRALISATAAVVPIPGIDLAVDVGVLMKMLQEINTEFGLTPEQIELLAPKRRLSTYKAIAAIGSSVIGRAITREVLSLAVKSVAKRLATKTTAKYVPLAGQALAATMSFAAIKFIGDRHVDDCVAVAERIAGRRARPVRG
jgi:uncharacterized protein (DUF697 family)